MPIKAEKVTRAVLRGMTDGESVVVECKDFQEILSFRSTACTMSRILGVRFTTRTEGLTLTLTRHDE